MQQQQQWNAAIYSKSLLPLLHSNMFTYTSILYIMFNTLNPAGFDSEKAIEDKILESPPPYSLFHLCQHYFPLNREVVINVGLYRKCPDTVLWALKFMQPDDIYKYATEKDIFRASKLLDSTIYDSLIAHSRLEICTQALRLIYEYLLSLQKLDWNNCTIDRFIHLAMMVDTQNGEHYDLFLACSHPQFDILITPEIVNTPCILYPNPKGGKTPIMFALQAGKSQAVNQLIQLGANVSTADGEGMNALHYACLSNKIEFVELVLSKIPEHQWNEYVNTPDESFRTPLAFTAGWKKSISEEEYSDIQRVLIGKGASIHPRKPIIEATMIQKKKKKKIIKRETQSMSLRGSQAGYLY